MIDESTTRDDWRWRPMVGDIVESVDGGPPRRGRVLDTFYANGEGGMHVQYDWGASWSCCHRMRVVSRWYTLEPC